MHVGEGPHGDRSSVIFKGGRFEGPKLRGEILPGGGGIFFRCLPYIYEVNIQQDWEIVTNNGTTQTAHLDTRYNLRTHDGATIYLQTTGTRTGERAVLENLGEDESITADKFRMRLNLTMETGDPRYKWINDVVVIASSGRTGERVVYDAFQVL